MRADARILTLLGAVAGAAVAGPATAQPVALRPGKVVVAPDQPPLQGVTVLLADGKIAAVGRDVDLPEGTRVIDAPRAWAVAAFVDASCALSLVGDRDEVTDPFALDVSPRAGLDPDHPDFAAARAAGVATAVVLPGERNLVGGQGVVVKTTGAVWRPEGGAPLKLSLGPDALVPGRPPTSRAGAVAALRERIAAAHAQLDAPDPFSRFARGATPAVWAVASGLDVDTAIELSDRFGLRALLHVDPGTPTWDLRGRALQGRTVAFGPFVHGSAPETLTGPAAAAAAGARVALVSGAPLQPAAGLRLTACLAVAHGLEPRAALDAITRAPAQALGLGDRVGTLEAGKEADVVLLDGPPLALTSKVLALYVGGRRAFTRPISAAERQEDRP